jgi:hypothetical protein
MCKKLDTLVELEGFESDMEMLEEAMFGLDIAGICMNEGCDNTITNCDSDGLNYCEDCGTVSVKSCLQLAGIG